MVRKEKTGKLKKSSIDIDLTEATENNYDFDRVNDFNWSALSNTGSDRASDVDLDDIPGFRDGNAMDYKELKKRLKRLAEEEKKKKEKMTFSA